MSGETRGQAQLADDEASELEASPGTIAQGKYRLFAALGHGGMADVYLGVAQGPMGFNKLVVVKKLRLGLGEDDGFVQMFLDEGRLAARLNHPNVVHTYEIGQSGETYFLAMEYLEGQPISNVVKALAKSDRKVEPALWARVVADALNGLHHAHELRDYDGRPMQVIHRDVSPQNLFLTYDGQVKLVDFGIAKAALNASQTETGVLKGKIAYMAPEQALGQTIDRRADIYAMGVVLWELLAGRRLVTGDAAVALNQVLNHDVPDLREVAPGVDEKLAAIATKALSRDAADRWPTAQAMRSALEEWLRSGAQVTDESNVASLVTGLFAAKREHVQQQVRAYMAGLSDGNLGSDTLSFTQGSLPSLGSGRSGTRLADASASGALAAAPPPPQRTRTWGVLVAAAFVVVAATASLWRGARTNAVAPAPPPAAVPSTVQITIVASPPSASLYLDGAKLSTNPYVGAQPKDDTHDHVIRVEAEGYQPATRTVRFRSDGSFELALVAAPPPAGAGAYGHPRGAARLSSPRRSCSWSSTAARGRAYPGAGPMEEVTRSRPRALAVVFAIACSSLPHAALAADPPAAPAPSPAPADNDAQARAHYSRGVQLYNEGAFEPALVELQRAYQLSPTYRLLYNTALVQMRLGDFVGALKTFRTYLDQGAAEIPAPRRAEVEKYLADLSPRVGQVEVTTNVPGAQVSIDDQPIGAAPIAPTALNPGRHRIAATKEGYQQAAKWIDVAGSDRASIALQLEAVAPAPVTAPPPPAVVAPPPIEPTPPPPAPPPAESKPPLWIGWTATGVLAAGAIVTGVAALSQSSKLGDEVSHQATDASTIHSTHDSTQRLAITSDILTGAALIAAGTTLYFTLTTKHREPTDAPHAELRVGPGSLGVHGTF